MHTKGKWRLCPQPEIWGEVSVAGHVYGLRFPRGRKERGITSESSVSQNGTKDRIV